MISTEKSVQKMQEEIEQLTKERNYYKDLHQRTKNECFHLRATLHKVPIGIYVKDKDNYVIEANPAFTKMLDVSKEVMYAQPMHKLVEGYEAFNAEDEEILSTGEPVLHALENLKTQSGRILSLRISKIPYRDAKGSIQGIIGIAVNLAEEVSNEQQMQRIIEQLKKAEGDNETLKQFSFSASHDLQEPLRIISSFLSLINLKLADKLDKDTTYYINTAIDRADGMQKMIRDVITFATTADHEGQLEPVDLNKVLQEAMDNLMQVVEESQANVSYDPLPEVQGNPAYLRQFFQNILSNSLKYKQKNIAPEITISYREFSFEYRFYIKDNGIGIPASAREEIFKPFKRLHSKSEYAGSGIGLATCKKIIDRHKGKIWVESEYGHGATFIFTLPKEEKADVLF